MPTPEAAPVRMAVIDATFDADTAPGALDAALARIVGEAQDEDAAVGIDVGLAGSVRDVEVAAAYC